MAVASICTVDSKGQKAELVDGSLVCHVSVRPAVRLILASPYSLTEPTPDGKTRGPMSRVRPQLCQYVSLLDRNTHRVTQSARSRTWLRSRALA